MSAFSIRILIYYIRLVTNLPCARIQAHSFKIEAFFSIIVYQLEVLKPLKPRQTLQSFEVAAGKTPDLYLEHSSLSSRICEECEIKSNTSRKNNSGPLRMAISTPVDRMLRSCR